MESIPLTMAKLKRGKGGWWNGEACWGIMFSGHSWHLWDPGWGEDVAEMVNSFTLLKLHQTPASELMVKTDSHAGLNLRNNEGASVTLPNATKVEMVLRREKLPDSEPEITKATRPVSRTATEGW